MAAGTFAQSELSAQSYLLDSATNCRGLVGAEGAVVVVEVEVEFAVDVEFAVEVVVELFLMA